MEAVRLIGLGRLAMCSMLVLVARIIATEESIGGPGFLVGGAKYEVVGGFLTAQG